MEFDLNNMDRDGLFGCLLAVLEKSGAGYL